MKLAILKSTGKKYFSTEPYTVSVEKQGTWASKYEGQTLVTLLGINPRTGKPWHNGRKCNIDINEVQFL